MTQVTDQDIYSFDLNGYLVKRGVLSNEHQQELHRFWDAELTSRPLNDVLLTWSDAWSSLIDLPGVYEFLHYLFEGRFRLDHAFCVDENFVSNSGIMHHESGMFNQGIFYSFSKGRPFSGLVGVLFALTEHNDDTNHFCCIPGSHKSNVAVPEQLRQTENNELVKSLHLKPGDALIFSEALVHGTRVTASPEQRRGIFIRYINSFTNFRKPPGVEAYKMLAPTIALGSGEELLLDETKLTDRQKLLVQHPAYHQARPIADVENPS